MRHSKNVSLRKIFIFYHRNLLEKGFLVIPVATRVHLENVAYDIRVREEGFCKGIWTVTVFGEEKETLASCKAATTRHTLQNSGCQS